MKGGTGFAVGVVAVLAAASATGCTDPIPDFAIRDLGGERDGIPQGEHHRAGQPCTVCHDGNEAPEFSLAGTVFAQSSSTIGVDGASVFITDSAGASYTAKTNCVGNFFVRKQEFDFSFPILVSVASKSGSVRQTMNSHIGRARSCASCHITGVPPDDPRFASSVQHVWLYTEGDPLPAKPACPVDPDLGWRKTP